jgi:hypothetical protein
MLICCPKTKHLTSYLTCKWKKKLSRRSSIIGRLWKPGNTSKSTIIPVECKWNWMDWRVLIDRWITLLYKRNHRRIDVHVCTSELDPWQWASPPLVQAVIKCRDDIKFILSIINLFLTLHLKRIYLPCYQWRLFNSPKNPVGKYEEKNANNLCKMVKNKEITWLTCLEKLL